MPTTAAKLSCQPTSCHARGSSPSVTAHAISSPYQRDAGRPASAASVPAMPIAPARTIDGPGAGQRDVQRDQRHHCPQARPRAEPRRAPSNGHASTASSVTFWPETASRCARPERLKSSDIRSGMSSSAPSTMPRASAACASPRPAPTPASARRRTESIAPSRPPRRRPVSRIRSACRMTRTPPRRRYAAYPDSSACRGSAPRAVPTPPPRRRSTERLDRACRAPGPVRARWPLATRPRTRSRGGAHPHARRAERRPLALHDMTPQRHRRSGERHEVGAVDRRHARGPGKRTSRGQQDQRHHQQRSEQAVSMSPGPRPRTARRRRPPPAWPQSSNPPQSAASATCRGWRRSVSAPLTCGPSPSTPRSASGRCRSPA